MKEAAPTSDHSKKRGSEYPPIARSVSLSSFRKTGDGSLVSSEGRSYYDQYLANVSVRLKQQQQQLSQNENKATNSLFLSSGPTTSHQSQFSPHPVLFEEENDEIEDETKKDTKINTSQYTMHVRQTEDKIKQLQKENFNLRLKIYFLERRVFDLPPRNAHATYTTTHPGGITRSTSFMATSPSSNITLSNFHPFARQSSSTSGRRVSVSNFSRHSQDHRVEDSDDMCMNDHYSALMGTSGYESDNILQEVFELKVRNKELKNDLKDKVGLLSEANDAINQLEKRLSETNIMNNGKQVLDASSTYEDEQMEECHEQILAINRQLSESIQFTLKNIKDAKKECCRSSAHKQISNSNRTKVGDKKVHNSLNKSLNTLEDTLISLESLLQNDINFRTVKFRNCVSEISNNILKPNDEVKTTTAIEDGDDETEYDEWSEPDVGISRKRMGLLSNVKLPRVTSEDECVQKSLLSGSLETSAKHVSRCSQLTKNTSPMTSTPVKDGESFEVLFADSNKSRRKGCNRNLDDEPVCGSDMICAMDSLYSEIRLSEAVDSGCEGSVGSSPSHVTEDSSGVSSMATTNLINLQQHVDTLTGTGSSPNIKICSQCDGTVRQTVGFSLQRSMDLICLSKSSLSRLRCICYGLLENLTNTRITKRAQTVIICDLRKELFDVQKECELKRKSLYQLKSQLNDNYKLLSELSEINLKLESEKQEMESMIKQIKKEDTLLQNQFDSARQMLRRSLTNMERSSLMWDRTKRTTNQQQPNALPPSPPSSSGDHHVTSPSKGRHHRPLFTAETVPSHSSMMSLPISLQRCSSDVLCNTSTINTSRNCISFFDNQQTLHIPTTSVNTNCDRNRTFPMPPIDHLSLSTLTDTVVTRHRGGWRNRSDEMENMFPPRDEADDDSP